MTNLKTAGELAYEGYLSASGTLKAVPWGELPPEHKLCWESAANAAIASYKGLMRIRDTWEGEVFLTETDSESVFNAIAYQTKLRVRSVKEGSFAILAAAEEVEAHKTRKGRGETRKEPLKFQGHPADLGDGVT